MQIGTLANFSGRIAVAQGILTTSRDNGLQSSVDIDVTDGGTFLGNPRTALVVNHQQGFGALTGRGLVDFSNGSISVGNGDKSGTFNGTLRSSRFAPVVKTGSGKITLNGDLEYRGTTRIDDGELEINGNFMDNSGSVSLFAGSGGNPVLSGSAALERISGTGLVSPGEGGRAGILTTANLNLGGLDFAFELSASAPNFLDLDNSLSDVLRVTENVSGSFNSSNEINLYLDIAELSDGDTFAGGLFTRFPGEFLNPELAQFNIFIEDSAGGVEFNGRQWAALDGAAWDVSVTSTFTRARFEGEGVLSNGYLTGFSFGAVTVVPIPGAVWLFTSGIGLLGWFRRRR
jgi:autotransporter-associated beta strand protein